jgi:hypothetical protein
MILLPRTLADFSKIDSWISAGRSDAEVLRLLRTEWRSEIVDVGGVYYCTECFQAINLKICTSCGQTLYDLEKSDD